jgi:hypothetical protein
LRSAGQCERDRLHLGDASSPAAAEHRPRPQRLQEGKTLVTDGGRQHLGIAHTRVGENLIGDGAVAIGQADDAAQHLAAATDA